MKDMRYQLSDLWRAASRMPGTHGGRAVLFVSARASEGTSSVAASFALLAAARSHKAAWLIDLDLRRNSAYETFQRGFAGRAGRPGRAYDASLNQAPFYTVVPELRARDGRVQTQDKLLTVHRVGESRLMVSRFRNESLKAGQKVQLRSQPAYWRALKAATDWIVLDAPSLERSAAALAVCGQMDGVVLVVEADKTSAEDVVGLRREIEDHGGRPLGVVLNGVRSDARLADRLVV